MTTVATVERAAPLSPGQERLLAAEYALPDGKWPEADVSGRLRPLDSVAVLVNGAFDVDAIERAVDALVAHQAALRTTFRFRSDAEPVQLVASARKFRVGRYVLPCQYGVLSEPLALDSLLSVAGRGAVKPSDSDLFQVDVFDIGPERHLVLLRIHHLVSDGWSVGLLFRQLSVCYEAVIAGREPELPVLERTFAEVCEDMRAARDSTRHASQLAYWRAELAPPWGELALGPVAPPRALMSVRDLALSCPAPLVEALKLRSRSGATPGGLAAPMLSAFAAVAWAATGATDVRIGTMIANRAEWEREHLIGNFVNIAIVRIAVHPAATVADLVSHASTKVAAAMRHQDVPVQDVMSDVNSPEPLYRVTFALNTMRADTLTLGGLSCRDVDVIDGKSGTAPRLAPTQVDLRFLFETGAAGALLGKVTYNVDLFDDPTIAAWAGAFQMALDRIAADAEQTVSALAAHVVTSFPALR